MPRVTSTLKVGIAIAGLCLAHPVGSSQPEEIERVIRDQIRVEIVNVDVVVRDRKNQPVRGLGRDDFRLQVDGESMEITNFYAVEPAPAKTSEGQRTESAGASLEGGRVETPEPALAPTESGLHLVVFLEESQLAPPGRERLFRDRVPRGFRRKLSTSAPYLRSTTSTAPARRAAVPAPTASKRCGGSLPPTRRRF